LFVDYDMIDDIWVAIS